MRSEANAPSAGSIGILGGAALILALALLAVYNSSALAAPGHPVLRTFSTSPNSNPRTVATDSAGNFYVGEAGRRIEKFSPSGSSLDFTGTAPYIEGNKITGIPGEPFVDQGNVAIAVDDSGGPNDGVIYYVLEDTGSSRVYLYAPSGAYLGRLPVGGGYRCGVAINQSNGSVYIGDNFFFSGLPQRFPAPDTGNLAAATPDGEINVGGCAIAVDKSGNFYAGADYWSGSSTSKYPSSQFATATATPSLIFEIYGASAMAVDPTNGDVYANKSNEIVTWDAAGVQRGARFGQLNDSHGLWVDGSRNVSTVDAYGGVYVYGPEEVQLPKANAEGASNVEATSADLQGSADPDGAGNITGCVFRYGEDSGYGSGSAPCTQPTPITGPTAVSAHLTGLVSGTTYHYRLFLTNANGTQMSTGDQTFTTTPATADVATEPATDVRNDRMSLNGSYTGDGQDVHYFFEWGRTSGYGRTAPAAPDDAGAGSGPQRVAPVQISGLEANIVYHYRLVVSTPSGITRGQDEAVSSATAVGDLKAEKPTTVTETTAELRASYTGDGVHETHYYFEWGQTAAYGNTIPAPPGNSVPAGTGTLEVPPVLISGLQKGAVYHFRVIASNATGTTVSADQTFRTADAPLVSNLNSRNVKATSAELTAEVNPRYGETTYVFEWGASSDYENSDPVPAGNAGSGDSAVPVSVQLEGLPSGVTYHFRLVATNQYGTVKSPDQVFGFYPPTCPNSQVRQEVRANALPDCRAYELVSPTYAQGAAIMPFSGPTSSVATSPPRLVYAATWGAFQDDTGEPTSGFSDKYVSTRTPTGWVTRYVGIPATGGVFTAGPPAAGMTIPQFAEYPGLQRGTQATPSLDRVIDYGQGFPGQGQNPGHPSNAPYVWSSSNGALLERWPTSLDTEPENEFFVGMPQASPDFTHFVFTSNLVFAEGGQKSKKEIAYGGGTAEQIWPRDYVYDNNIEADSVVLASVKSAAKGNEPFQGRALHISDDGSRILIADQSVLNEGGLNPSGVSAPPEPREVAVGSEVTGPLYLRVDGEETVEFGAGHKFKYVGSTPDGETVYVTSEEQLTADDQDTSRDIFAWHESEPNSFTRISFGDHGEAGNTDNCKADEGWVPGCGAAIVGINAGHGSIGNGVTDNYFASEGDDFYFESPEQLVGQRGDPGERNLYLYRDGAVRFLATLRPNAGVTRMQVTPNGAHMALVTASNLTDYNSGGRPEMYVYDPDGRPMTCASCRPDAKQPTSDVLASGNGLFLTSDGRVFFTTRDPLVARDTNENEDVYEFTEGKPQLITTGLGPGFPPKVLPSVTGPGFIGVSADGTDVYFATIDNLVTQDHNGAQTKVYDARTAGGFPAEPEEPKCVAADECHGPSNIQSPLAARSHQRAHRRDGQGEGAEWQGQPVQEEQQAQEIEEAQEEGQGEAGGQSSWLRPTRVGPPCAEGSPCSSLPWPCLGCCWRRPRRPPPDPWAPRSGA